MVSATDAADGPVIGGAVSLGNIAPSMPPPNTNGPGAQALSGLVFVVGLGAVLVFAVAKQFLATNPAMQRAHKKAAQMAAEMRRSARDSKPSYSKVKTSNTKKKPGSKAGGTNGKRSAKGKGKSPLVAPTGAADDDVEEEDARLLDAESATGAPSTTEEGVVFGGGQDISSKAGSAVTRSDLRGSRAGSRRMQPPEPVLEFGEVAADDDDDEDEIYPDDSVSNVGFLKPYQRPRMGRRHAGGSGMPTMLPEETPDAWAGIEEEGEEGEEESAAPEPYRSVAGGTALSLGQLNPAVLRAKSKQNDDSLSTVHEKQLAMRSLIPCQEVDPDCALSMSRETDRIGGAAFGSAPARMLSDDDNASDVTFNFASQGAQAPIPVLRPSKETRPTKLIQPKLPNVAAETSRTPLEPVDDDDASDVTFNFGAQASVRPGLSPESRKSRCNRSMACQPPKSTSTSSKKAQADEDVDDGASVLTFNPASISRGDADDIMPPGVRQPRRTTKQPPPPPPPSTKSPLKGQVMDISDVRSHMDLGELSNTVAMPAPSSNDDAFTSVALSSRPRNPYGILGRGAAAGGRGRGPPSAQSPLYDKDIERL